MDPDTDVGTDAGIEVDGIDVDVTGADGGAAPI